MIFKNLFRKTQYLDWEKYAVKKAFIEDFYWQQSVRKESIKNIC